MTRRRKTDPDDRPMTREEAAAWATDMTLLSAWREGDRQRRHGQISNAEFYGSYAELEVSLKGSSKYTAVAEEYRALERAAEGAL